MVQNDPPIVAPVSAEELSALSRISEEVDLAPGRSISSLGILHDHFYILLNGELDVRRRGRDDHERITVYKGHADAGQPLLLSPTAILEAVSTAPCRLLRFSADTYLQWVSGFSPANAIIVSSLIQRVRTSETMVLEGEKLAALGKMAATLAHELNNPAAAAGRAASELGDVLAGLRSAGLELAHFALDPEQISRLDALQGQAVSDSNNRAGAFAVHEDPLAESDREDELGRWLEEHQIEAGWRIATPLARAGLGTDWLDSIASTVPAEALGAVTSWIAEEIAAATLAEQIVSSTARLSELVAAVKSYSYLDRAPMQEVDIHEGLESTLVMLRHKLKGIELVRAYGEDLPKIRANPGELNQVWTNLIDNAVDALGGQGRIELRTYREASWLVVEVADNGPGIPPEVQSQIFEAFFTTKSLGAGMGLGLAICRRIVEGQHHGDIRVDSCPGDTRFQVYLPIESPADGPPHGISESGP